jgi:hypothetical protein
MSEMRRAARALLERHSEAFESRHSLGDSKARLEAALDALALTGATRLDTSWREENGRAFLDADFQPPARTRLLLNFASLAMTLLVLASAWMVTYGDEHAAATFLVPLFTAFAIFALPFVAVALGSRRAAEESRIRRAIRKALVEADADT